MVHFKQGRKINPGRIRKAARKVGIVSLLGCTLLEVIQSRKAARQEYNKVKWQAPQLWKDYLYDKVYKQESLATDLEWKQAVCLLREEHQRDVACFMRHVLGRTSRGSVNWIEMEVGHGEDATMVCLMDHAEVEATIMENNEKDFD